MLLFHISVYSECVNVYARSSRSFGRSPQQRFPLSIIVSSFVVTVYDRIAFVVREGRRWFASRKTFANALMMFWAALALLSWQSSVGLGNPLPVWNRALLRTGGKVSYNVFRIYDNIHPPPSHVEAGVYDNQTIFVSHGVCVFETLHKNKTKKQITTSSHPKQEEMDNYSTCSWGRRRGTRCFRKGCGNGVNTK